MSGFSQKIASAAVENFLQKTAVSRKKLITAIRNAAPHRSISDLGKLSTRLRRSADKLDFENIISPQGNAFGFKKEKALVRYGGEEEAKRQMRKKVGL